ncbi:MAG: peptidylprolyl isomerase, partial [bacterium]|nr:peptidylprolyl isomerase [bacterium]
SPEGGYGPHHDKGVQKVPRAAFKEAGEPKVGAVVSGGQPGGQQFQATIVGVTDKEVTLDLNHPLAGKTLNFDVEIVGVE